MPSDSPKYCGRFAPSPTGPLHFGSLVAAVASYVDARAAGGRWLVRIEDLDAPRSQPGAASRILSDLEAFGLIWDGPVVYQSARTEAYRAAFERLRAGGHVYPCGCTRKDLAGEGRYPGTCAQGLAPGRPARAWRVHVAPGTVTFQDLAYGERSLDPAALSGDFVVLRADGPFSYQFAVVVDDTAQNVSRVVRGADLLEATHGQIYLQLLFGLPQPEYLHVPVVTDALGVKLSKQTRALPVRREDAPRLLCDALSFLGYRPPAWLTHAPAQEILAWACQADQLALIVSAVVSQATGTGQGS